MVNKKRIKHLLRRPFEWIGVGLALLIFPQLSHQGLFRLCDFVAAIMYAFDRKGKMRALFNLRALVGGLPVNVKTDAYRPTQREATIIRRSYRNMARTVGHALWTCRKASERVQAVGEVSPRIASFLASHKPAVTVSGHLGCWEILSQLAFLQGHEMMSVAKNIGTDKMTALLMKSRMSIGQEIVPAAGAFRLLMSGLKSGKSLGLLVDQSVDPADGGKWVRFCGHVMPVSIAPAFFAAKGRAPILVAWSRPLKDGRYRCEYISSYHADEVRDIWGTTQRCLKDLERVIRRHPSCWVLNYNYTQEPVTPDARRELEAREAKAK